MSDMSTEIFNDKGEVFTEWICLVTTVIALHILSVMFECERRFSVRMCHNKW